jgi:nucleotide-binding universal stress UspA family protein
MTSRTLARRSHRDEGMKRILVALDGSPRAPLVLAAAARLAESSGAKLVMFRAVGIPVHLPTSVYALPEIGIEDILRTGAQRDLDKLASTLPARLVERIVVEIGTAWDSIVRAGRTLDADLIVLGSHGYSGLDHLLGTTAAKVVNRADRNVLVVRTPL